VYRLPVLVFSSVTGWWRRIVRVAPPLAYEPPTMPISALVFVQPASRKTGAPDGNVSSVWTRESFPLTETTTAGAGAGVGAEAVVEAGAAAAGALGAARVGAVRAGVVTVASVVGCGDDPPDGPDEDPRAGVDAAGALVDGAAVVLVGAGAALAAAGAALAAAGVALAAAGVVVAATPCGRNGFLVWKTEKATRPSPADAGGTSVSTSWPDGAAGAAGVVPATFGSEPVVTAAAGGGAGAFWFSILRMLGTS